MSAILKNPRITEKGSLLAEGGAYVFDVANGTTKNEIIKAIKTLYKVTPRMIRTLAVPSKKTPARNRGGKFGKPGSTSAGRKAYVYLKKGDKIEVL